MGGAVGVGFGEVVFFVGIGGEVEEFEWFAYGTVGFPVAGAEGLGADLARAGAEFKIQIIVLGLFLRCTAQRGHK